MTVTRAGEFSDVEWLLAKLEIARAAWKSILAGFLLLAILGAATLFAVEQPTYSSHMVVPLPANVQALIHTDAVLVPVVRKIYPANSDLSENVQRLQEKLTVTELKKGSGLFTIEITDHSPQRAQAALNEVLNQIVVVSKPFGTNLASAQQQMESEKRALTALKEFLASLKDRTSPSKAGNEGDPTSRSFGTLISDITAREQRIWELQNYLEGLNTEDVAVRPTLASRVDPRGLYRKLAMILLVSLVLPVAFVLLRDFWRKRKISQGPPSTLPRAA